MKALVLAVVVACGGGSTPTPIGSRVGPALSAAFAAADQLRAPWRCAADGPALATETLNAGARTWKLSGTTVKLEASGPVSIGVVADAGGSAAPTLAALGRLQAALADADVIVSLGGMGATQAELEATLGTLAERAPVIAIPGDLESVAAHTAAVAALRARGRIVIDGRLARRIELPGVAIATVPGARTAARLAAGADGCGYAPADVTRLLGELTGKPGIRILAIAEAPRRAVDGEASGELAATPGAPQEVDLVLHGPTTDSGSPARTGSRDGAATALTPGTSDATTRLPGPRRAPSAGLLVVSGTSWRWKLVTDAS